MLLLTPPKLPQQIFPQEKNSKFQCVCEARPQNLNRFFLLMYLCYAVRVSQPHKGARGVECEQKSEKEAGGGGGGEQTILNVGEGRGGEPL